MTMIQTKVTRMLALAGFAPAGKSGFVSRQERSCCTERRASTKRIANAFLGKLNWGKRADAVLVLYAATAIALPAQTFPTLASFDRADGGYLVAGLVQATNGDLYGT